MGNYDAFAAIYDQWSAHMTEDVPYYVELAQEAEGPLVELAVGSDRAAAADVQLELLEADMRDFEVDEAAGLVYCPFRALLHLPGWHDKRRAFERVAAALRPGGRFAWNAFCFSYRAAAENEGHNDEPVPHTVTHSPAESRIDIALDRGGETSIWWATKSEWEGLVDVAGLETEALYGWFDRRPFDDESEEFVWIARKPD